MTLINLQTRRAGFSASADLLVVFGEDESRSECHSQQDPPATAAESSSVTTPSLCASEQDLPATAAESAESSSVTTPSLAIASTSEFLTQYTTCGGLYIIH